MNKYIASQLLHKINSLPNADLARIETPIEYCPKLSESLGCRGFYVKREDMNGLAFGGNKVPMLELILGNALNNQCDSVVNVEYAHSNFDRQLAAACAKLDLDFYFMCQPDEELARIKQGNYFLSHLLGAKIQECQFESEAHKQHELQRYVRKLTEGGKHVYIIDEKDRVLSTLAYVKYFIELMLQLEKIELNISSIVCSAHAATQAGLVLANYLTESEIKIVGIRSIDSSDEEVSNKIVSLATKAAKQLGVTIDESSLRVINDGAFANDERGSFKAIRVMAQLEGILLDPVYTGKALNGVLHYYKQGKFKPASNVLFIHTGGTPNLFGYTGRLIDIL